MFAALIRNIAITGVAYGVVAGVGLALAPFLIAVYGLGGYGQILIARAFLPSGFFALFDLGLGETATREVAAARAGGRWAECSGALTLLAAIALAAGAVIGLVLFAGAGALAGWFDIAPGEQAGFVRVLQLTALLQPVLLLALVAEGVLKGFERFEIMRSVEVVAALVYAGAAVWIGLSGIGPNWVAVALLGSLLVRLAIAAGFAVWLLARQGVRPARWARETRREVARWTVTMLSTKLVGVLQNQVASPLIGLILNPAAVGLYDAVVRLPRFAKVVFGLVGSTALPLASRLRTSDDRAAMGRLAYYGLLGATVVTWPAAIACAAFSQPILSAWIGPEVAQYWIWQSAMFAVMMLSVPVSFANSMAMADRAATARLVRITAWQVGIQLVLSLVLVDRLAQWAFVLGQLLATIATLPFQYRVYREALFIERNLPGKALIVLAGSTAAALALAAPGQPGNFWELALQGGAAAAIGVAMSAWLVLGASERSEIFAFVRRNLRAAG